MVALHLSQSVPASVPGILLLLRGDRCRWDGWTDGTGRSRGRGHRGLALGSPPCMCSRDLSIRPDGRNSPPCNENCLDGCPISTCPSGPGTTPATARLWAIGSAARPESNPVPQPPLKVRAAACGSDLRCTVRRPSHPRRQPLRISPLYLRKCRVRPGAPHRDRCQPRQTHVSNVGHLMYPECDASYRCDRHRPGVIPGVYSPVRKVVA